MIKDEKTDVKADNKSDAGVVADPAEPAVPADAANPVDPADAADADVAADAVDAAVGLSADVILKLETLLLNITEATGDEKTINDKVYNKWRKVENIAKMEIKSTIASAGGKDDSEPVKNTSKKTKSAVQNSDEKEKKGKSQKEEPKKKERRQRMRM